MSCSAAFGEESPITGQVKQAYTRACHGKTDSEIHMQALREYRVQAKEYHNTLHIISSNRAKVVDEIMELYKDKNDKAENELAIAQAEIQSLEDIITCNTSSHGNGSLALATRPDTDSEHEDAFPVAPATLPVVDKERRIVRFTCRSYENTGSKQKSVTTHCRSYPATEQRWSTRSWGYTRSKMGRWRMNWQ